MLRSNFVILAISQLASIIFPLIELQHGENLRWCAATLHPFFLHDARSVSLWVPRHASLLDNVQQNDVHALTFAHFCVCMYARSFAGNLPSAISERDLEDEFIRFGTLRSVWIARKPPGFGAQSRLLRHR